MNELVKWAWVAGLIDGEGSFYINIKSGLHMRVTVNMTDLDVMERLHYLLNGKLYGPYPRRGNRKDIYSWRAYKKEDVICTIEHIYHYLCRRRKDKCDELIKAYEDYTGNKVNLIDYDPILAKLKPKELELVHNAYCAGIIEGEGCIRFSHKQGNPVIKFKSTDEDIVDRFFKYAGLGNKCGPYKNGQGRKAYWSWSASKVEDYLKVTSKLKHFMLSRRAAKFNEVEKALTKRRNSILSKRCIKHQGVLNYGNCKECALLNNKSTGKLSLGDVDNINKLLNKRLVRGDKAKIAKKYNVAPSLISHMAKNLKKG